MDSLSPYLQNPAFFRKLAEEDLYPSTIKSGKYKIVANESSRSLLNRLQDGAQEEVRLQIKIIQLFFIWPVQFLNKSMPTPFQLFSRL
ncbi:Uncharacterised protein [Weeksella virosa]|nr:Uncharacterised protein [Weeksella virosa]